MRCVYWWATCHCKQYKNIKCCTKMLLWWIYVAGSNKTCLSLHVECPTFLPLHVECPTFLPKFGVSRQIFINVDNIKFHENPSSGAALIHADRTDRRTDMTKLKGAFREYANAPVTEWLQHIDTTVFWHFTSHSVADVYQRSGRTHCLHLSVPWIQRTCFPQNTKHR